MHLNIDFPCMLLKIDMISLLLKNNVIVMLLNIDFFYPAANIVKGSFLSLLLEIDFSAAANG